MLSHSRGASSVSDAHSSINYHQVSPVNPDYATGRSGTGFNSIRASRAPSESLYPSWVEAARRSHEQ